MARRNTERLPDRFHGRIAKWLLRAQSQSKVEADKLPVPADEGICDQHPHPRIPALKPASCIEFYLLLFHADYLVGFFTAVYCVSVFLPL